MEDQTFSGQDVLIVTEAIDVLGVDASRVPGQIDVLSGRFSPCSRCNQKVQDYGFSGCSARAVSRRPSRGFRGHSGDSRGARFSVAASRYPPGPARPAAAAQHHTRLGDGAGERLRRPALRGRARTPLAPFRCATTPIFCRARGNLFTNGLLGGRTTTSYLGGGVNHRFYTETGQGRVDFFYVPSFVLYDADRVPVGKTRDEVTFRVRYDTADELFDEPGVVSVVAFAERDDERPPAFGRVRPRRRARASPVSA